MSSNKNSEHQRLGWISLVDNILCIVTYCGLKAVMLSTTPWGEDDRKFHIWTPPDFAYIFPLLTNFNLYLLPVIKRKYNSFQWVPWVFSGELSNLRVVVGASWNWCLKWRQPFRNYSCSLVKIIAKHPSPKKRLKTNKIKFLESRNFINIIQCKKYKIFKTIDILRISIFCNTAIILMMMKMKMIKTATIYCMSLP